MVFYEGTITYKVETVIDELMCGHEPYEEDFAERIDRFENRVYSEVYAYLIFQGNSEDTAKKIAKEVSEEARGPYDCGLKAHNELGLDRKHHEMLEQKLRENKENYLKNPTESLDEFKKRIYDEVYDFYMKYYEQKYTKEELDELPIEMESHRNAYWDAIESKEYCEEQLKKWETENNG